LIFLANGGDLTLANSIFALNTTAGSAVISLRNFGGTLHATDIIASEAESLTTALSSHVNSLDPAFVDPANGDYHLRPDSPAVDYHLTTNPGFFLPIDLDGRPRGVPLLNNGSAADIGAYELQSLGRLIFTQSPANLVQGATLGTVVVAAEDASGNVEPVSGTVDFTIAACGTVFDLGSATMTNGVAALTSAQRFYTPNSGLSLVARYGSLSATSAAFAVSANSGLLFSNGFESCRL
jgi:hypothetical protein